MVLQKSRIAIISPQKDAYSETFIKNQKKLDADVFYYYGGLIPTFLEGYGRLNIQFSFFYKIFIKLGIFKKNIKNLALAQSLKKNRIDVLLANYGPTGENLVTVSKMTKIPLVVHFHGYDASMFSVLEKYSNYKNLFKHASKVIVVSNYMAETLEKLGCPKSKLEYIVYGPYNDFLTIEPTYSSKNFIGIGRFVDKKAPYYSILAFSKIAELYPDSKFILAGDGFLLSSCKNLVTYLGLNDRVLFPGIISQKEFQEFLQNSLALVQHSIKAENGDMEGTPVAILEASAAGIPVISTYHAGIPDVVIDKKTGLLGEEHDVQKMADAMKVLLEDQNLAKTLGQAGKRHIKNNYTLTNYLEGLLQALQSSHNV
ncbi:glycosyltransferase [Leeuwenhoekiella sp. A16]|uniref:glycosyltransferase n=1 Tax=Leeuwenhoekiella sp. A16 TaxID=3141462 RepID=UPI003A808159